MRLYNVYVECTETGNIILIELSTEESKEYVANEALEIAKKVHGLNEDHVVILDIVRKNVKKNRRY